MAARIAPMPRNPGFLSAEVRIRGRNAPHLCLIIARYRPPRGDFEPDTTAVRPGRRTIADDSPAGGCARHKHGGGKGLPRSRCGLAWDDAGLVPPTRDAFRPPQFIVQSSNVISHFFSPLAPRELRAQWRLALLDLTRMSAENPLHTQAADRA